jgi:hypothetical protein
MRKAILTAAALMLVLAIPSSAATTLSKVTLIVEGSACRFRPPPGTSKNPTAA